MSVTSLPSQRAKCLSALTNADRNGDSQLSPWEYSSFVNHLSGGIFQDVFLFPLDKLPMNVQSNFYSLACHCFNNRERHLCCSLDDTTKNSGGSSKLFIDIAGVDSDESQGSWPEQICTDTLNALFSERMDGPTTSSMARQGTTTASITTSLPRCYNWLILADATDQGILTTTEFVTFVNSMSNQTWLGYEFTDLPTGLQNVFTRRVESESSGSMDIQEYMLGEWNQESQMISLLRSFCDDTFSAIANAQTTTYDEIPNQDIMDDPTSSPSSPDIPTPTALGLDSRQSPSLSPTTALNDCFIAMIMNDGDSDEILDSSEYAAFCNQLSGDQFAGVEYDNLAPVMKEAFVSLSSGSTLGIDIQGVRPTSTPDEDQLAFLEKVCFDVDEAIGRALDPVPTAAPSVQNGNAASNKPSPLETPVTIDTNDPTRASRSLSPRPIGSDPSSPSTSPPSRSPLGTRLPIASLGPALAPSDALPTTSSPTLQPSLDITPTPISPKPTISTSRPTTTRTPSPTEAPSRLSGIEPTPEPNIPNATLSPEVEMSSSPTSKPTRKPSSDSSSTSKPTKIQSSNPTISPTTEPTLRRTKFPTALSSTSPSKQKPTESPSTEIPLSESPSQTLGNKEPSLSNAPSAAPEGTKYYGNITFTMSNSARLDEDHLQSGKNRNELNAAFKNLIQNATGRILGEDSRQRQLRHRERLLQMSFSSDGQVDLIVNAPCPPDVPTGTLCEECYASYLVNVFDASSSTIKLEEGEIQTELEAAIEDGELQRSLDDINPETPVRIEEGTLLRQRNDPAGVYTVAETSVSTTAIYIAGATAGLLVLICVWIQCCSGRCESKRPPKQEVASRDNRSSKRGLFGR